MLETRFGISLLIVFSLIFSSCAGNVYTVAQLQETNEIYGKAILQKVKVRKQNDEVIFGSLYEITADSTAIRLKKNQELEWISNEDIKFIVLEHEDGVAPVAAIIFVLVLVLLAAKGQGEAISQI